MTTKHNHFPQILEGQIGDHLVRTVNGRELHASLHSKTDFTDWAKRRIADCQFEQDIDFTCLKIEERDHRTGKIVVSKVEYFFTVDAAKEAAMLERNARGREVRKYFIECERQLNASVQVDDLSADVRRMVGGIMKSVIHKELEDAMRSTLPAMVHAELAGRTTALVTDCLTAGQILNEEKVAPVGRKGLDLRVSNSLRRFCERNNIVPKRTDRGTSQSYVFPRDIIHKWLAVEGRELICRYKERQVGQGNLFLVGGSNDPKREGLAVVNIDGRTVLVDLRVWNVTASDEAIVMLPNGTIIVSNAVSTPERASEWQGKRAGFLENDPRGCRERNGLIFSDGVTILGKVLKEARKRVAA